MKKILFLGAMAVTALGIQSCLDYDDPGSELGINQSTTETTVYHGNADSIGYRRLFNEHEVKAGIDTLNKYRYLNQSMTGQYCLRGAKNGDVPGGHAYQRQYSLGADGFAQYFVVPHRDFMYGTMTSTYNVSEDFNGDALGAYTMVKNALMPILNHPAIDSIPEFKAINLLYYCVSAQEQADLSGPYTYLEDKQNSEEPTEYNDLKTIYHGIVENLDTIVACLKYYDEEVQKGDDGNRPKWYQAFVNQILSRYCVTSRAMFTGDMSMDSYIRLANSLKLRMAMHIVKVEPDVAKQWAEEAVASGVIENADQQHALYPMVSGFTHPLLEINGWGDIRLCASFESLLCSLNHPYLKTVFTKNQYPVEFTDSTMAANTRVIGIRAGQMVGEGQNYPLNPLEAYSTINASAVAMIPCYLVKWAEVDFLRAEGALRGWNMGGTAEFFYNRGIENAYLSDPMMADPTYQAAMSEYMNREQPVAYVSHDPYNGGQPWQSVTKIGVKWNEGDSREVKLEKIITQKYIALFPLSTEAWTELRRTGYPALFPVLNTDDGDGSILQGEMIRRIPWNASDPLIISCIENSGLPALGGEDLQATRLWWDVPGPNF